MKKGIFFRSGSFRNLSERDVDYLKKLNIQNLLDFREGQEVESTENQESFSRNVHRISAVNFSGHIHEDIRVENINGEFMKEFYRGLPFENKAYANMFQVLSRPDAVPYLHNCSAGKDRTGVASALIQLALGVSEADVFLDYMKSMNAFESLIVNEVSRVKNDSDLRKVFDRIATTVVMPDYLQTASQEIKSRHGNYEVYFEVEFNLGD